MNKNGFDPLQLLRCLFRTLLSNQTGSETLKNSVVDLYRDKHKT